MAIIQIEAEDWMITAGLIGLVRLFPEDEQMITKTGVTIHSHHIEQLPERYFSYLLKTFSIVERDVGRMSWYTSQLKRQPEKAKQYAADVRKMMNEQLKKVEKYFPTSKECKELNEITEALKLVKKDENAEKVEEAVQAYRRIMSTPFIDKKLTLNYVKAVILSPFFGQPSFFQPVFNAKSLEEHIYQFEQDFTYPAKMELELYEQITRQTEGQAILGYLERNQEYKPFKDWYKKLKKREGPEIQAFFAESFPCSFIYDMVATQSFEEMIFSPLALSKDKAVNFNWEFNRKNPVPISSLARLLLFLVPIGLAFYTRRIGSQLSNETLRFAGILLSQQPFPLIVKENETYQTLRQKKGNSFGEAVANLLEEVTDKAQKLTHSYLFVEVYSSYTTKKTLLDYYHMPPYLASYLSLHGKVISKLGHRELKDEFLRTVLKGQDPKRVVFDYLRLAVNESWHAKGAYIATQERWRIIEARKGAENVVNQDKKIHFIYTRGRALRAAMIKSRPGSEELYRASGGKKAEGIAYRLLNALKAGNTSAFMDTIFRVHMAADLSIPSIFTETYKEEGLDFETIGSAFIAGLLNQERKQEGGQENG
ncbi:type I-B CRISPR-associated protein Cas8b1/Cst1 [Alkalihalobacillus oceani]|uniref:type I-B CRISPR-associated protein Cas8b1/Cst1 n=1 Tax=Halalkalibacter oceani TaxID=1653776 RepID=UPI00203C95DB|nr:type I-B CRISPR-associated protein Cas8b1/Cst1 [Halalkalibacter oceani]MCM3761174.1 type I-B CRISPR-associated protein Cas8b1/Cst1 [Halalkalibacter oceani]